ncbi:MDR family MFS transporter [Streptomyces sp. NPDC005070]
MEVDLFTVETGRVSRSMISGLPRAFWWLWVSTLVNRMGSFVATFTALYLTLERGYSASFAGLVAALLGLGGVISALGAGVMADRLGRRPTILVAQVFTAVSVAVLAFMTHPAAIAGVAFLVGMSSSGSRPAIQAMIADIVRPEDRMRAFSINFWAINLGIAISSVAAGFIAEKSYLAGFLGEAAMTLVCAVVVFAKVPESHHVGTPMSDPSSSSQNSRERQDNVRLGSVLRDGRFMAVIALSFVIALLYQQGSVGLPIAMGEDGFSSSDFGMVIAVNGILIVVLQIPATRRIQNWDASRLLIGSALLAGFGFGLTMFAESIAMYAFTVGFWTLAEIVAAPTHTNLVVRISPAQGRGRYQGVYSTSWAGAALVAPLISGFVIDHFGGEFLWATCALLGVMAACGYWLLMRGVKNGNPRSEPPSRRRLDGGSERAQRTSG